MPWYVILAIVVALLTVPFIVGGFLAKRFRMPDHGWKIGLILCLLFSGIAIIATGWPPKLGIDLSGGVILVYEVDPQEKRDDQNIDMDKLISAVKLRVDPGGIKEVTIRQYGPEQIEIVIPEVDEAEAQRIEDRVSRAGSLEFRILANRRDHDALIERALREQDTRVLRDEAGSRLAWWVPVKEGEEGSFDYPEVATRTRTYNDKQILEVLVVDDDYDVTGGYLANASPGIDNTGNPSVKFSFDAIGAEKFGALTGSNLPDKVQDFHRKLGIILDGFLYSAPRIQTTIHKEGEITGSFTQEEVQELVNVLNAGSLPTALTQEPISSLKTGPTLGQDTIRKGTWAISLSMVLVLIFMLVYYRFAGLVACFALLMNLVLILAVMIAVGAAFTLPGVAGLVLTVGMAVDANVLIFERIREELNRGAALRMAIRNGFGRALSAIVDANLTTLIVATVLYWIGTDQVRGFAVVLWLGVVMSMFTAIFCARVVFDIAEKRKWISGLKMMQMVGHTHLDFLGMRHVAAVASTVLVLIGLTAVVLRGKGLLDIDFTGGVSVEILFNEEQSVGEVRKALAEVPEFDDLAITDVQRGDDSPGMRFMVNTSLGKLDEIEDLKNGKKTAIEVVEQRLHDVFGDKLASNSFTIRDLEQIGPAKVSGRLSSGSSLAALGAGPMLLTQTEPAEVEQPASVGSDADTETAAEDAATMEEAAEEQAATEDQPVAEQPEMAEDAAVATEETTETPAERTSEEGADAEEPTAEPATETEAPVEADAGAAFEAEAQPPAGPFAGGAEATLVFEEKVTHDTLMDLFASYFGSQDSVPPLQLSNPGYREGHSEAFQEWTVKIKLPPEKAESVLRAIEGKLREKPFFPSSTTIGGKVAGDTRTLAITALLASLVFIIGYIWIRFQRVMYGLAAVVALVHDVLITLGALAISAYLAGPLGILLIEPFKIGLPVLAAFLTIIGYSLNDTIVVFDRIREVRGKAPRLTRGMINTSINQTLGRTLLTSLTTLIVVVILYIGGGQGIHAFAFSLVVGVVVGTYSSIFVASPLLLWMSKPAQES